MGNLDGNTKLAHFKILYYNAIHPAEWVSKWLGVRFRKSRFKYRRIFEHNKYVALSTFVLCQKIKSDAPI